MTTSDRPDGTTFLPSRYNLLVPVEGEGGGVLYNARTGASIHMGGPDAEALGRLLKIPGVALGESEVGSDLLRELIRGGFVIASTHDELEEIRARYWGARKDAPAVLTVTTTMDCNLGCYYCYEERSLQTLALADVPAIVELARRLLLSSGKRSLHVDWYGGEPLLNVAFLEAASEALQALCRDLRVTYSASIISNGTSWPEDVGSFVVRHSVRQVQISFDGLEESHNRRRRFRPGRVGEGGSSFERAVQLVDKLLDHVRVDVRMNFDRANRGDAVGFVRFARSRGWFNRPYPAVLQPARLASYSPRSQFLRPHELSAEHFDALRSEVRTEAGCGIAIEESEAPDGYPFPRQSVCAALARDSVVVGAEGSLYRCGLQVGESRRSVGQLRPIPLEPTQTMTERPASDGSWWRDFDPTQLPSCSVCSFLPICLGGCPKRHLEGDEKALAEQGRYWRRNLPRLVAAGTGFVARPGFTFEETDQFR